MTKEFLSKHGVPFISKNLIDPDIIKELAGRGFRTKPVTFIDGKAYQGYNPGVLSAALGLQGKTKETASTTGIYGRMDRVLTGWVRAVDQIPPEWRLYKAAESGYSLRNFVHCIRHLKGTMRARNSGTWDLKYHFGNNGWRKMKDFQQLASFAERVRQRFQRWSSTLTQDEEDQACDGFYGLASLSRLVEISLGYYAFHLRNLYGIMRNELGIEPVDPLDDKELLEIGIPSEVMG